MIGQNTVSDAEPPIAVEFHVAAVRDEEGHDEEAGDYVKAYRESKQEKPGGRGETARGHEEAGV
jgi:hypothetical protein